MVKALLRSLVLGLLVTACAGGEPAVGKRALLTHMLTTSVQIFVERDGGVRRAGSAVVISLDLPGGRAAILTTAHLLEPPVQQSAYLMDTAGQGRIPAEIVAVDPERDLALVTAPWPGASRVELAAGAGLADEILIVAFRWGRRRTVVKGAVSQLAAPESLADPFSIWGPVGLVDASVSYGMSGGGVFDRQTGQLVGLVRGYRTAHLSLSSEQMPLKLPIAGETTVISTRDIACFLREIELARLLDGISTARFAEQDCVEVGSLSERRVRPSPHPPLKSAG